MSTIVVPHTAPPVLISAPTREPGRFGLFSAATLVAQPELRFQSGVEFEPAACGPAAGVSGVCVDVGTVLLGAVQANTETEGALPFAVYGWYDCSAFSRPVEEAEERAREHLALGEEREVERAITAGDLDNTPSLAGAVDLTPAGGPTDLVTAVGILEGHLGTEYGAVGVIHMPRSAAAAARSANLIFRHGQRLETEVGNYVAAGGGYDLAAGYALYATSIPSIRRSDVFVTPDEQFRPDTRQNNVIAVAQRVYLVAWECVTARVDIDQGAL